MKMNIRTLLSLLLSTVLLLGLLTGCTADTPAQTSDPTETQQLQEPTAAGMLLLNVNAAVEIFYDTDGLVMSIRGADDYGVELANAQEDVLGKSMAEVVKALTQAAADGSYLNKGQTAIIVKQSFGSELPGSSFLENILVDIQSVGTGIPVVLVVEDNLDGFGYIDLETAKNILVEALALEDISMVEGNPETENELYVLSFTADDVPQYYTVNANTGTIREADVTQYDEDIINGVDPEGTMYDPYDPAENKEETFPEETEALVEETEEDIAV